MSSYIFRACLIIFSSSFVYGSVYESLTELLPFDARGWYGHPRYMEELIREKNATTIIELGSWKGNSTIHLAKQLPEGGVLYAVDHWFAPPYDQKIPVYYKKFDTSQLYNQFLSNVIHSKLTNKIIPIRSGTIEAASFFQENKIFADIIYIDASHNENDVYADLNAYFPFLKDNGVLCGDDWDWGVGWGYNKDNLPIQRAVTRFARENNLKITLTKSRLWILSPIQ